MKKQGETKIVFVKPYSRFGVGDFKPGVEYSLPTELVKKLVETKPHLVKSHDLVAPVAFTEAAKKKTASAENKSMRGRKREKK